MRVITHLVVERDNEPSLHQLGPAFKRALLWSAAGALVVASGLAVLIFRLTGVASSQDNALSRRAVATTVFFLWHNLCGMVTSTMLVPSSLDLITWLMPAGTSASIAGVSGLLISMFWLGYTCGVLMWRLLGSTVCDQRRCTQIIVACAATTLVSDLGLAAVSYDPSAAHATTATRAHAAGNTWRLLGVFGCVLLMGICHGVSVVPTRLLLVREAPPGAQTTISTLKTVADSIGAGLGPMLAFLANLIVPAASHVSVVGALTAVLNVSLLLVLLILGVFVLPSSEPPPRAADDPVKSVSIASQTHTAYLVDNPAESKHELAERFDDARRKLFRTYLVAVTERAWLVSSLEVATSMVLEIEFRIARQDNGLVISACFLIGTPFVLLALFVKRAQWLAPETLVVVLATIVVLLVLLLFRTPTERWIHLSGDGSLGVLLTASTLVYPMAYSVAGILDGLALGYAVVPGSRWYTAENLLVAKEILASLVGRFAGPPVARLVTGLGGRDAYAALQLGAAVLSLGSCISAAPAVRLLTHQQRALHVA